MIRCRDDHYHGISGQAVRLVCKVGVRTIFVSLSMGLGLYLRPAAVIFTKVSRSFNSYSEGMGKDPLITGLPISVRSRADWEDILVNDVFRRLVKVVVLESSCQLGSCEQG